MCFLNRVLDCGMRISEICNLKIEDIYFDKRFIHIKQSKGNKDRLVPMLTHLKSMLYRYIHFYCVISEHSYVLQNIDGDHFNYEAAKNIVRRIKNKTGIKKLKNHLIRHSFATSYVMCGGDVASLTIVLGHSDIMTTN